MYISPWFLALFSVLFKFDVLVRVYDVYLLEGSKIIYRIALTLLKLNEGKIYNIIDVRKNLGM